MNFITVLTGIPIWIYALLILLIYKWYRASQEGYVVIKTRVIIVFVFLVMGLSQILQGFRYITTDLLTYCLTALIGISVSYLLSNRYQQYRFKNELLYKNTCYLPLIFIMINMITKITLTIYIAINPDLFTNYYFNIIYSIFCGFAIGLIIGILVHLLVKRRELLTK